MFHAGAARRSLPLYLETFLHTVGVMQTPAAHRAAFDLLRDAGLPCTVHAGESAGVESIAAALDCGARRLDHGVRIADEGGADGALGPVARRVHDLGVPLELCPTSNVHTGAATDLAAHPVERLRLAGFTVTINTDNRLMSDVTLSGELAAVSQAFRLGADDLEAMTSTAADAAFLDDGERRLLRRRIADGFHAVRSSR